MNLMKPKTVAGAVAPLLKVLHNLEGVVNAKDDVIQNNATTIDRLEEESKAAVREASSAKAIIRALNGIINPDTTRTNP